MFSTNSDNAVIIFNEIYDKYYDRILRYFKKDFGIEDSEDLTQQTFMQLWAWLPSAYAIKNTKALIYRIAKTVKLDRFRKNALMLEELLPEEFDVRDDENYYGIIECRMLIDKLSKKEQNLLLLSLQGYNSKEISHSLGISPSATRTRLQKIRKKLNELY